MNEILQKRFSIAKNIIKWNNKLKQLQDECPHTDVEKTYGANTGNYDPSADCYWTHFYCPHCGKSWREDGSK